jgi:hypothetical protein
LHKHEISDDEILDVLFLFCGGDEVEDFACYGVGCGLLDVVLEVGYEQG